MCIALLRRLSCRYGIPNGARVDVARPVCGRADGGATCGAEKAVQASGRAEIGVYASDPRSGSG